MGQFIVLDLEWNQSPAGSGGAVSIAMDGTAEISDCTFTDNSAGSMGGAIYCDHEELNITDLHL